MILTKELHGLRSSGRAFRAHFADFVKSMGFCASRHHRDVWMLLRETNDGYDYICTHVDDFKIVARDPTRWSNRIAAEFLLKSIGPPAYNLGNDYNFSRSDGAWVVNASTYIKECIRRLQSDPDLDGSLYEHRTPMPKAATLSVTIARYYSKIRW